MRAYLESLWPKRSGSEYILVALGVDSDDGSESGESVDSVQSAETEGQGS